jgi:hypothetical protein
MYAAARVLACHISGLPRRRAVCVLVKVRRSRAFGPPTQTHISIRTRYNPIYSSPRDRHLEASAALVPRKRI